MLKSGYPLCFFKLVVIFITRSLLYKITDVGIFLYLYCVILFDTTLLYKTTEQVLAWFLQINYSLFILNVWFINPVTM